MGRGVGKKENPVKLSWWTRGFEMHDGRDGTRRDETLAKRRGHGEKEKNRNKGQPETASGSCSFRIMQKGGGGG